MSFIFSQKNFCEFFSIHADFKKTLLPPSSRNIYSFLFIASCDFSHLKEPTNSIILYKKRKKKDRVCKLKKTRLIRAEICFSSQNISSYSFPALIVPLNCNCTFSRNYLATLQRLFLFLFSKIQGRFREIEHLRKIVRLINHSFDASTMTEQLMISGCLLSLCSRSDQHSLFIQPCLDIYPFYPPLP